MHDGPEVVVLRYGHRPGRDDRMTTHVGLTARALGADRVVFPDNAGQSAATVRDITDRFGGPFAVELRDDQRAYVRDFTGVVVHLTMYGEQIQDVEAAIRDQVGLDAATHPSAFELDEPASEHDVPATESDPTSEDVVDNTDSDTTANITGDLLVVVGGEKVPWALYERADFNVGVTNQPHSEVAGLAVFLDRLFQGSELDRTWTDADRQVIPMATGKKVVDGSVGDGADERSEDASAEDTSAEDDSEAHRADIADDTDS